VARNKNSGWSRRVSAFFAAVIILGGVTVSLGFAVRLRDALQRNAQARMQTASVAVRVAVEEQLARYVDTVRLAAAGLSALPEPTDAGFQRLATAVASQKLTAVTAMRFVVPISPDDRLEPIQQRWAALGATDLAFHPVAGSQQYLFTVYAQGLNGHAAPATGIDQSAAPAEVEVARLARTNDSVAVSDAYVLLADTTVAKSRQTLSFDVAAPIMDGRGRPTGYVMLSVGGREFVQTLLARAAGSLLDAQLLTRSSGGTLTELAAVLTNGRGEDVRYTQDFTAGFRQWVLRTSTDNRTLLPTAGRTDMVVLLAGSVLAVMFGTLMYLQMSATQRMEIEIELEVEERLAQTQTETDEETEVSSAQP
jgi:hypothetical protein